MTSKTDKPESEKPIAEQTAHKLTASELNAVQKVVAARRATSSARIKLVNEGGVQKIAPDHPNATVGRIILMEAFGTTDPDFLDGILSQLNHLSSVDGQCYEPALNFIISYVKGNRPSDHNETLLLSQMVGVHNAIMNAIHDLANAKTIQEQDYAERRLNKLCRTFVIQMEGLKRYRTAGNSQVVQHVSVGDGGQAAIVNNLTQTPSQNAPENTRPANPALTHEKTATMPLMAETKEQAAVPSKRGPNK